jgi:hypothetical protein
MRKRPEDAIQRAVMQHFAARPAGDVFNGPLFLHLSN